VETGELTDRVRGTTLGQAALAIGWRARAIDS
jgi:hypothetical protein